MRGLVTIILTILFTLPIISCNKTYKLSSKKKFAASNIINQRLGRGINIGDTYENAWNPQKDIDTFDFARIANIGMRSVRIPIRWEIPERTSFIDPYTISSTFFKRIKNTVDAALRHKLHVIINMHNHDSLYTKPDVMKPMFIAQWRQIADFFKAYPDSLLFEVLNEPHDNLDATHWNHYFVDALAEIRKTNPERTVLLGLAERGGINALNKLIVPNDEHLILTIHYYNPFQFTHQGASWVSGSSIWLGTKWNDTEFDRQVVASDFEAVKKISLTKNIPINIGEFGAYSAADIDSRVKWTRFLARWFEEQGFSWNYWEFNSGFGIYNTATGQYNTSLMNALLTDLMTSPTPVIITELYNSNFNNLLNDGWNLYNNDPSASSTASFTNNKAIITITSQGNETWHIQLIKHTIPIISGKTYRIVFNSYARSPRTISCQLMQSAAPWNVYTSNDFIVTEADRQFSFLFTANINNPNCNFVFSLGNNVVSPVTIYDIKLQEITIK